MATIKVNNKNTANPQHWKVRDVFFGYTPVEQTSWFITIQSMITFSNEGVLKFNYLTLNDEQLPEVFERMFYELDVKAGIDLYLKIDNATPFSLSVTSANAQLQAEAIVKITSATFDPSGQSETKLFLADLDPTIAIWENLFSESANTPIVPPPDTTLISTTTYQAIPLHKFYPATNNLWNQASLSIGGINDVDSPTYYKGDSYVYDRFFKLNPTGDDLDNSIIEMTSPWILGIAKALNSPKYSVNELNNTTDRVANLGYYIQKNCNLLGHRVDANGKVQEAIEKSDRIRTAVEGRETNDPLEYNPNGFGSKGMLVRHLPNKASPGGTVSGGYRKIHDLPQLFAEYHEQASAAVGYQEGTAIEILIDGQKYRYPNQLALLTELLITSKQTVTYSKGAFFSSLVSEQSIKEVMGALGLRTVDKFLEFKIADKTVKLYYKGISASQSIRRKLSAISTNIAMTLGNLQ